MSVTISGSGQIVKQVIFATATDSSTASTITEPAMTSAQGVQAVSASITPTSSLSKILVMVSSQISGGNNSTVYIALFNGSNNIQERAYFTGANANNGSIPFFMSYVDSPATTSPITYSIRYGSNNGSFTQYYGRTSGYAASSFTNNGSLGQLILMEISGS